MLLSNQLIKSYAFSFSIDENISIRTILRRMTTNFRLVDDKSLNEVYVTFIYIYKF